MRLFSSYTPNDLPTSLTKIGVLSGVLLLSACEAQLRDLVENVNSIPVVEKVVAEGETVVALPTAHTEAAPEIIILQDGVDAFLGYKSVEIPEDLSGTYPELNKGILAFILAFNLREIANEEGVSSWAKIRTSSADETTWQYELSSLPDDAVYATEYKVYFEKIDTDYRIARIGHRVKCYRGNNPKQWTVKLCT